jgi:hypothetical protein
VTCRAVKDSDIVDHVQRMNVAGTQVALHELREEDETAGRVRRTGRQRCPRRQLERCLLEEGVRDGGGVAKLREQEGAVVAQVAEFVLD